MINLEIKAAAQGLSEESNSISVQSN